MAEDEYGDDWEGEDKNEGDAKKNHKHLQQQVFSFYPFLSKSTSFMLKDTFIM